MHDSLASAIEFGLRKAAKGFMHPEEYEQFVNGIRKTKIMRVGADHQTLHDVIRDHAIAVANWATNNRYAEASHQVEEKKQHAIHYIKTHVLRWHQ